MLTVISGAGRLGRSPESGQADTDASYVSGLPWARAFAAKPGEEAHEPHPLGLCSTTQSPPLPSPRLRGWHRSRWRRRGRVHSARRHRDLDDKAGCPTRPRRRRSMSTPGGWRGSLFGSRPASTAAWRCPAARRSAKGMRSREASLPRIEPQGCTAPMTTRCSSAAKRSDWAGAVSERHQLAAARNTRLQLGLRIAAAFGPLLDRGAGDRLHVGARLRRHAAAAGDPFPHAPRAGVVGRRREPEVAELGAARGETPPISATPGSDRAGRAGFVQPPCPA